MSQKNLRLLRRYVAARRGPGAAAALPIYKQLLNHMSHDRRGRVLARMRSALKHPEYTQ